MKIPKNSTQALQLTPSGLSFSQFWSKPIHIASVFATLSFSLGTFSKQLTDLKKTTVVSSENFSS